MKFLKRRTLIFAAVLSAVSACAPDTPVAPEFTARTLPWSDSLSSSGLYHLSSKLDVKRENANQCNEGTPIRDAKGKVVSWNMKRSSANGRRPNANEEVELYKSVRFDQEGKQTFYAECVLAKHTDSKRTMREIAKRTNQGRLISGFAASYGSEGYCEYSWNGF